MKYNFCLSSKLISVQLYVDYSFYNKQSQFCLFGQFCPVFTWDKFVCGAFEDLSTSAKIC